MIGKINGRFGEVGDVFGCASVEYRLPSTGRVSSSEHSHYKRLIHLKFAIVVNLLLGLKVA